MALHYISTRGRASALDFQGALLAGLAGDGGLYLPADWPALPPGRLAALAGLPYAEAAIEVMRPFVDGIAPQTFERLVREAYAGFGHPAVAPLRQLDANLWLLELFHGPTLAFKDVAMQLLGRLFDEVLERQDRRVTIVGATSGDTGSAAIEACRDRARIDVFMMHPKGRVSEVQRRQMTTVMAANVHNLAVAGTFDDCQALVKAMFADAPFRDEVALSAVNSINWARVLAQTVYFVWSAAQLGAPHRAVRFVVPTGNFGDVYAGYVAMRMGVPVEKLVVATNRNDILHRFFSTGEYRVGAVAPTQSPSMDIQVASNFERLLLDLVEGDAGRVAHYMTGLREAGGFRVAPAELARARATFASGAADEAATARTMAETWRAMGMLVDPHTAVALAVARAEPAPGVPTVVLSTAHPAKFPDAVERATGVRPELPPRLADLYARPERCRDVANELAQVEAQVRAGLGRNSAPEDRRA